MTGLDRRTASAVLVLVLLASTWCLAEDTWDDNPLPPGSLPVPEIELDLDGIEVWIARLKSHLLEFVVRVNGVEPEHTYPSVRAALAAFQARSTADGGDSSEETTTADDEGDDPA